MVSYKFENDAAEFPIETHEGDFIPEGFVAFDGGRVVEWANEKRVGGKIVPIPQPEPPAPYVPSKQELLQQLDTQYQLQFTELAKSWANAMMDNDTKTADEIASDRAALKKEYEKKRGEIDAD